MKGVFVLVFTVFLPFFTYSQSSTNYLREHVSYLASDALKGRYPGTEGDSLSACYIAEAFQKLHFKTFQPKGFQYFKVPVSQKAGATNSFTFQNRSYNLGEDFSVFPFSSNATLKANIVFASTGLEITQPSIARNDYATIDVKGKWVLLFRSYPDNAPHAREYKESAYDRAKVLLARDKGAAGVLFVNLSSADGSDELVKVESRDFSTGIPVIQLKRKTADNLFAYANACDSLEKKIKK